MSLARVAQAERRYIAEDLRKHVQACLMCNRETTTDCPTGKALRGHLERATMQLELLRRPDEAQLDLGEEFSDD